MLESQQLHTLALTHATHTHTYKHTSSTRTYIYAISWAQFMHICLLSQIKVHLQNNFQSNQKIYSLFLCFPGTLIELQGYQFKRKNSRDEDALIQSELHCHTPRENTLRHTLSLSLSQTSTATIATDCTMH